MTKTGKLNQPIDHSRPTKRNEPQKRSFSNQADVPQEQLFNELPKKELELGHSHLIVTRPRPGRSKITEAKFISDMTQYAYSNALHNSIRLPILDCFKPDIDMWARIPYKASHRSSRTPLYHAMIYMALESAIEQVLFKMADRPSLLRIGSTITQNLRFIAR